jgi:hypothetical protein
MDVVDGGGNDTHYLYDAADLLFKQSSPSTMAKDATNPSGTPTKIIFTKDNLLLSVSTPVKGDGSQFRLTTYAYDGAGRKTGSDVALTDATGVVLSDAGSQTFAYYRDGRLQKQTGRGGETITNHYDPNGNLANGQDSTSGGESVQSTF